MTDPSAMLAFPYPHRIHPLHALFGDAFRTYQPIGQQERMVLLFQGLCTAAGMIPEKVSAPARARTNRPARAPARQRRRCGSWPQPKRRQSTTWCLNL